jgi:hypothetical protein
MPASCQSGRAKDSQDAIGPDSRGDSQPKAAADDRIDGSNQLGKRGFQPFSGS